MKSEILRILQMQADGKLTQDQAAELLAILADQARENGVAPPPNSSGEGTRGTGAGGTQSASSAGAPGPSGEEYARSWGGAWKRAGRAGYRGPRPGGAGGVIHDAIDAAIGMGTTVGRAASIWGEEFINMVHRDDGGNSVTLSKVSRPNGEEYTFRGNTFNVAKVSQLTLENADFSNNTLNGSRLVLVAIRRGRFCQCDLSGSSLAQVAIEGPAGEAAAPDRGEVEGVKAGFRGAKFTACKLAQIKLMGGSAIEASTFQAAAIKDLELHDSTAQDCRFNDSTVWGARLERAAFKSVVIERSHVQGLAARDITLDRVTFGGARVGETTLSGGTWANVQFRGNSVLLESTFDHCALDTCTFENCTFRRTTLRNLNLKGISLRNIDLTGMTLETDEAFRKAAGL